MLKMLADTVVQAVAQGIYAFSLIKTTLARLESFLMDKDSAYLDYIPNEDTLYNVGDNEGRPAVASSPGYSTGLSRFAWL